MAARSGNIYVEIAIGAPLDRVWQFTQTPDLHQRWDLRFSEIRYLPRPDPAEPQRFLYATRIGFGLRVRGEGETVGEHGSADGERTSALKFWSDDSKSLIRQGSGYWKYIPDGDGACVRFLTAYDYSVRFGLPGRIFDRLIFRPLIGWATAWSFDRLRLWAERDIDPALSMRRSIVHVIARLSVALVWLYQGIVPKLIMHHPDELRMLQDGGVSSSAARPLLTVIGWIELVLGLTLIVAWRARWPLWLTIVLMPAAAIGVIVASPSFTVAPFNPITFNLCVFALALIALLGSHDLPSARRCLRAPALKER